MVEAAILIIFPFAMAFAAISDVLSMTIQNRVSLLLVAAFIVLAPMTGMPMDQFGMHFVACFAVLVVTFGLFATGTMGGGDAKLMSATALWMGWSSELLTYLLAMAIAGGFLTLLILRYRKSSVAVFAGHIEFMNRLAQKDEGVPYGVALGLAGLWVFPQSALGLWVIQSLSAV